MRSINGFNATSRPEAAPGESEDRREELRHTAPIASRRPGKIVDVLKVIEGMLPRALKPRKGFLLSFKNRILAGTLLVLIGVVIIIGVTLQITVFPSLKGDSAVIINLKIIHFLTSVIVIAISWVFIEWISKKIASPLLELAERADQISREAGERIASSADEQDGSWLDDPYDGDADITLGDEIFHLTSSFNRMLFYLKASETRLRESEEKYRFLFDNNPSPIFVFDADDMMILDVNARAEEEYQFTREELLAMSFEDLGLDQDRERTSSTLRQIFPTEATPLPVLHHIRKDGTIFMVNFLARLGTYRNQPAIIAAVWDVTERLEKHAMLIQASKMATLGEMATGIAHELNQPLNVIRLGCDYLNKRVKSGNSLAPEDLKQVSAELASNVDRAARIIGHLRQFGRRADETMYPTDINKPIRNVFTLLGTQLEARSITWRLNLKENLPEILGDENRLEQVLINLIMNARDAMLGRGLPTDSQAHPGEKRVTIRSTLDKDRVVVTISDTGPGIPESLRARVFEPFYSTKKTGEGTGLGLSISYGIIKEHNGTIEIDASQRRGTTFRLTFPAL